MWLFSLFLFSNIASSIAASIPPNPSVIQVPPVPLSNATSLSPPDPEWPAVPWYYRTGSKTIVFSEYGRDASPALSQTIQFATLDIEQKISKGPASYRVHSFGFREGIVTFYIVFSGQLEVSREEIFQTLETWRAHASSFGPREIAQGEIMAGQPPVTAASFTIRFDRFEDMAQS